MKTISVVTPCFNEEGNVREVYERVRTLMPTLGQYRYEHIFIDNASHDSTFDVLKNIAAADSNAPSRARQLVAKGDVLVKLGYTGSLSFLFS